jgi:hypothetical protein
MNDIIYYWQFIVYLVQNFYWTRMKLCMLQYITHMKFKYDSKPIAV